MGPWAQNSEKNKDPTKNTLPLNPRRRVLREKVATMVPSSASSWSQNGKKIHPKINQKIDASWDRFLEGFWWILGGKMEPSWHQNGIKNWYQLRKNFF